MNFSAKKLLTQSAKQLCYLMQHQEKDKGVNLSDWVMEGQVFQENVFYQLGSDSYSKEMGGCYTTRNGDNIYFSHDIVKKDGTEIWETKRDGNDRNYISKSLLQCAVYDVLTRFSSPYLRTSKFNRTAFNDEQITLKKSYKYYLQMGGITYLVSLINPYPILQFIEEKTIACRNYESAMAFDTKWKGNEFKYLESCFNVKQLSL